MRKQWLMISVLTLTMIALTACNGKNGAATQAVTPTQVTTPTQAGTPTPTATPTATPVPTFTPTPTPKPAERKISSSDVITQEFFEANKSFFDSNKPLEEQIEDRKEYLGAFDVLDKKEIDTLVKCINKETTGVAMTQAEIDSLYNVLKDIIVYNQAHQDAIIPLSLLGVDLSGDEIAVYNYLQEVSIRTQTELPKNSKFNDFIAHSYTDFFSQIVSNSKLLKPTVIDGERKNTRFVDADGLKTSCKVVLCIYAVELMKTYNSSTFSEAIKDYGIEKIEQIMGELKTAGSPDKTSQE